MAISTIHNKNTWKKYRDNLDFVVTKYGDNKIELDYETPFQLLCAVILSAQTTDKQVNKVTPPLFAKVRNSKDITKLSLEEIQEYIKYINFFRNKSRFIYETGKILTEKTNGHIPNDLKFLQTLPGVGVKTAKVVLGVLYNTPYIGVDTHIHRVTNRWGLVNTKTPNETDKELDATLPNEIKKRIHHPLVLFGRYDCTAKKPKCKNCPLAKKCNYGKSLIGSVFNP